MEDVRSLSLPGTYHEKIAGLGDSLNKFIRLKTLDVSRNAIESLEGLDRLKLLEKLNLYYNSVANLQELYRLRFNQKLQELDLRLNPVARNEPDYRLFLIHMLPNLRKLDDRAVRDSERKAALMHYSSDAATKFTEHEPQPQPPEPRPPNPRAEHVKTLGRPHNIVDNDDAQLLNYAMPGYDPKAITGSVAKQAAAEDYPNETLWQMNKAGVGLKPGLNQGRLVPEDLHQESLQQEDIYAETEAAENHLKQLASRYPNIPFNTTTMANIEGSCKLDPAPSVNGNNGKRKVEFDPTLSYSDGVEAYTSYQNEGNFTPAPKDPHASENKDKQPSSKSAEEQLDVHQRGVEMYSASDLLPPAPPPPQQEAPKYESPMRHVAAPSPGDGGDTPLAPELKGEFGDMIIKISNMVDKYWNGSKSLLTNQRFLTQITNLMRDGGGPVSSPSTAPASLAPGKEFEMTRLKAQLEKAKKENEELKERLFSGVLEEGHPGEDKGKNVLLRTQRDLKIVRDRLQKALEENKVLTEQRQKQLQQQQQQQQQHQDMRASSTDQQPITAAADTPQLQVLKAENSKLRESCNTLNIRLKQSAQMQELAAMLQESHKSLVSSNEQLLKELEETRRRHQEELQQLTSAHQLQLRRAMHSTGPNKHPINGN